MAVPLIAAAIAYGLRIVGLRIIPYLVREGTRMAIKRGGSIGSPTVARKVGTQKITETGYIVVTKNPNKFKLAQSIFGKDKVFKSDILAARSTSSKSYQAITEKTFKNLSPEIKRTVAGQMDDAANGVSRFIINPKSNPAVGGTKVTEHFNKLFGQKIKFTEKTLKNIAKAEQGPTALGKGIITTAPKIVTETTKKIPEVIKLKHTAVPRVKTGKEIVSVKELPVKRPWYVAIVPPWLRTSKSVTEVSKKVGGTEIPLNPYLRQTTEGLNIGRTIGTATGLSVGVPFAKRVLTPDKPEKRITTDLNIDQLFGGTTGPLERTELDVPQSIEIFDE